MNTPTLYYYDQLDRLADLRHFNRISDDAYYTELADCMAWLREIERAEAMVHANRTDVAAACERTVERHLATQLEQAAAKWMVFAEA